MSDQPFTHSCNEMSDQPIWNCFHRSQQRLSFLGRANCQYDDHAYNLRSGSFDYIIRQYVAIDHHKLNGKTYLEWAQTVKLVIDEKGKLGHLTSEVKKPADDDPNLRIWRLANSMVTA
ncbi:uncharacterized protein A4U43_C07F11680 [Asparagus officinalis]|uniref:Retrotransposon Copia-like N-terminal domain-containing protein n=1 Tax=Asparagus officinalis TaxID=4686 RepID=A0A5P1EB64_ASPOF|nr:uncharacterized protein A4U43_C07F11680 [Asparagus officinalis]